MKYTVIYALRRSPTSVYPHECHHHVAHVTAANVDEAIDRCRQDMLPGFDFQLVAVFSGHADRVAKGDTVRAHEFSSQDKDP